MSINNPYQTYKENTVTTASPGDLTLMLYNGCLKFIKQGRQAILDKNIEEKNTSSLKVQEIIRELMATLNMEYEISHQMMLMYDYILNRLIEANVNNNLEALDEASSHIKEFRDTWQQVIRLNRKMQYGQGL